MSADAAAPAAGTRAAVRFFWVWLILATGVSVAGNVAHAVLTAPGATVRLAALAAVVPPAVLLGSTHSVALLVKTRRVGCSYWCALAMTVTLAGCAFVLSFDALRDLAVNLGMASSRAWLWPVAIDVSIANSTLSLLSLTSAHGASNVTAVHQDPKPRGDHRAVATPAPPARVRVDAADMIEPRARLGEQAAAVEAPLSRAESSVPRSAGRAPMSASPAEADQSLQHRWRPTAEELVRTGVTSKDPAIVAAVLADYAAGTAPSTIGRRHRVHHSTVGRILAAAAAGTTA